MQLPAFERKVADDRLQERRLAGAVGAEKPDRIARQHAPFHAREHGVAAVTDRRILEAEELARLLGRGAEFELEWRIDVRGGDALELLQRLDAALRLPRLRRLRAEAQDERLEVRDRLLLFFELRLLVRKALGALRLERRVVARVRVEAPILDMHDLLDDRVQELAVVRDDDRRARKILEPV